VVSDNPADAEFNNEEGGAVTGLSGARIAREAARHWKTTNARALNFCIFDLDSNINSFSWGDLVFELNERDLMCSWLITAKLLKINDENFDKPVV